MHCRRRSGESERQRPAANARGHRQEIETWVSALGRYDNNEFDDALKDFDKISDTSKILFNMGVIHATLGEHEKAVSWPPLPRGHLRGGRRLC